VVKKVVSLLHQTTTTKTPKIMATHIACSECPIKIKVGDIITFTNKVGHKVTLVVKKIDTKSWYDITGRNSYGTLIGYAKYNDFQIN
jgi:hypothetical protein